MDGDAMYDVIVIGAGPAGMSAAVECKINGMNVVLLEKTGDFNGMISEYYKDGKRVDKIYKKQDVQLTGNIDFCDGTKESTMSLFRSLLDSHGVDLRCRNDVDSVVKDGDIFLVRNNANQVYKARFVVIAIGKMGKPNKPDYHFPPKLRNNINFNANSCVDGEKVLVVGGGNSAVEYALHLLSTCDVTLNYRGNEFVRLNDVNLANLRKSLEAGSIKSRFGVDILRLEELDSRLNVVFKDGTSCVFDRIIYAIGGIAPVDFLRKCGISLDSGGVPDSVCAVTHESNVKGLFVAGDLLFKSGGSIAIALNHGHDIASEIKNRI